MPTVFGRLREVTDTDRPLTPERWREVQPCRDIRLGSRTLVLTQPTSTFWVYLLGLLSTAIGAKCLWLADGEVVRAWWGIALVLWGIGALLAGTSYQAFGFHIKCSGRSVCSWTSWWEVLYLVLQQWSMSAFLIAVSHGSTTGRVREALIATAVLTGALYAASVLIGALRPTRSWITFERLVLVAAPTYLLLLATSAHRWLVDEDPADGVLLGAWIGLLFCMIAYRVYDQARIGPRLWRGGRGRWFSENDVLHVTLILWMIFIELAVLPAL